ncbi:MAG: lysozyme [Tabrizicola sp.]
MRKVVLGAAAAAAVGLALPVIKQWEGRELVPYPDIVGVLTWCDGETRGKPKAVYTHAECDLITEAAAAEFEAAIRPCLPDALPPKTRAAFISAAYNIGSGAFCRSSMSRRALAGDLRGACDALMLWTKAGGRVVKGLVNRRTAERKLCLEALP